MFRVRFFVSYVVTLLQMALTVVPVKQLRAELASVLRELEAGKDVVITQRGQGKAVLLDLARYNELIERLEYLEDSIDALEVSSEGAIEAEEFFRSLAESA